MFENPTKEEIDQMVQGYRDRVNKKEKGSSDPAYLHGFKNADYDERGTTEQEEHYQRIIRELPERGDQ